MKILILNESFNINHHSSAIGRSKLIYTLTKYNEVTVLYPDCSVPGLKNLNPLWLRGTKQIRFSLRTESKKEQLLNLFPKVRALPSYITGTSLSFQRLVSDWQMAISQEIEKEKYDLIIVLGTGMSFAPHFAMANIDTSIPWIVNIHDPFPAHYYPYPYRKKSNLIYVNLAKKFDMVLKKATKVVFPSLRLQEWMQQFYPCIADKSFVIPHCMVDEDMLSALPSETQDMIIKLSKDKFNIVHAGSLLGPRNPHYLISAFKKFIDSDVEIKNTARLNIIGKVAREHTGFDKIYVDMNQNLNIITDRVSYKYSLSILKQSDVLILLEAIAEESPFMPGKLADYIWADKPILALTPENSETARLLGEEYPYITQTDNEEEIYQCLLRLWKRWKEGKPMNLESGDLREYISSDNIQKTVMENIL